MTINGMQTNLKISVNEIVNLEILIIITPWIEEGFRNLDPAKVTNKLNDGEVRKVDGGSVTVVWASTCCQGYVE